MAQSHIISAIFLTLVSANMIQGGIIPAELFHEEAFPNLVNLVDIPRIGALSHDFMTSTASAASNALNDFKTHVNNFRVGLGQHIRIPQTYPILHRFVHGKILPNLAGPAAGVVPNLVEPGLYGGQVGDSGAASAVATSSAASGE